jgi:metallo-beta-lactamase class B
MRHIIISSLFLLVTTTLSHAQCDTISISPDIHLIRIADDAYVHLSHAEIPPFGRVGSNGLILVNDGEAFLFDTPVNDSLTKTLISWIQDTMGIKIVGFLPNHWHSDCMGGLAYLKSLGIESYANRRTIAIAELKHLPIPEHAFNDSLTLRLGDKEIFCYYPGPAHTLDNIVVWIPSERILFAGCMVKEMRAQSLGNTSDGDLAAYPKTIKKVLDKFGNARVVVPGHGEFGGVELLQHTMKLAARR